MRNNNKLPRRFRRVRSMHLCTLWTCTPSELSAFAVELERGRGVYLPIDMLFLYPNVWGTFTILDKYKGMIHTEFTAPAAVRCACTCSILK